MSREAPRQVISTLALPERESAVPEGSCLQPLRASAGAVRERAESGRAHEPVRLRLQRAKLVRAAEIFDPFRIGPELRALCLAIGNALIFPDMDELVRIADLGRDIAERLAEMAVLRRFPDFLIQLQMLGEHSRFAAIGAHIKQHWSFP